MKTNFRFIIAACLVLCLFILPPLARVEASRGAAGEPAIKFFSAPGADFQTAPDEEGSVLSATAEQDRMIRADAARTFTAIGFFDSDTDMNSLIAARRGIFDLPPNTEFTRFRRAEPFNFNAFKFQDWQTSFRLNPQRSSGNPNYRMKTGISSNRLLRI